jgi:hypothetical protein
MKQTLSVNTQERAHPGVQKTHNRELILPPNTLLVYNVFFAGDGGAVGYIVIRDLKLSFEFFDKVFFRESDVEITKDFKLHGNLNTVCGYVDVNNAHSDYAKVIIKSKKVISLAEKKRRDFLNGLTKEEMDIYRMYYKIRVKDMERKQGTCTTESSLLDQLEYVKSHIGKKFNVKNYIKGISKQYNFRTDKLYSGYQKRIACKRWAKKDFIENDKKFKHLSLPYNKGIKI